MENGNCEGDVIINDEKRQMLKRYSLPLIFYAPPCKWCVVDGEDFVDEVSVDRPHSHLIAQ